MALRGGIDTVDPRAEIDGVEITNEDLLLGKLMLEPQRNHRLLYLTLERPLGRQVHHAHELLGDRAAALARGHGRKVMQGRAHDAADVDSAMLVEAPVLDGDDSACEIRR